MGTPQKKLLTFFSKQRVQTYKKRQVILRPDERPRGVYFLFQGYIKDTATSANGEDLTLFIFKPDDVFPHGWIFNNKQPKHAFIAITDCKVYCAEKDTFLRFLGKNPDVLLLLTQKLTVRLGGVLDRLEYMAFGNAFQKVASIIIILGERFGEDIPEGVKILFPLSQRDIAELVGITRETASIEMKKLEDQGILQRIKRHYIIKSPAKLVRCATLR